MNRKEFISGLANLSPVSTFLTINRYRNDYGEIADYNLNFRISYKSAVQKSLKAVLSYSPTNDTEHLARKDLIRSYTDSLHRMESAAEEELENAYSPFLNSDGQYIKGIKLHKKNGNIHLFGLLNAKRIVLPGFYPDSKISDLERAKRKIAKLGPVSKYRQFRMLPYQLSSITVQGVVLTPPTN